MIHRLLPYSRRAALRGLALALGLVALLGATPGFAAAAPEAAPKLPTRAALLRVTPQDRILGKTDAPVTIIEYASLTCPHCAYFDVRVLPKVEANWIRTGKARLVTRPFPLDQLALFAAEVADGFSGGRYYTFIDVLFHSQFKWMQASDPHKAIIDVARLGGLSQARIQQAIGVGGETRVLRSELDARRVLGVGSTPTFFINGRKVVGAESYADFAKVLAAAYATAHAAKPILPAS